MSEPIDREHLKRDLSEPLSAVRRDQSVLGLDKLAASLTTVGPTYAFHGRLLLSTLEARPPHAHLEPGAGARQARARGAVSRYVRVIRIRRRRATRRRSRRAANRATARRAARTIRSIMLTWHIAHSVPATHSVVLLELSDPRHLCAEHAPSHHWLRDDISREGRGAGAVWRST